uniref:type I pullulanase n=1 Tax=Fulvivirga sp. TaxID=1931237 RepID=UPI00404A0A75
MKINLICLSLALMAISCKKEIPKYNSYAEYPSITETDLWPEYSSTQTTFKLWSPAAEEVNLLFYDKGDSGEATSTKSLERNAEGLWQTTVKGDLHGQYYTYQVKADGQWLEETPGIYAQAVGVNGMRAMVVDLNKTNPDSWNNDKGPAIDKPNEAIIYELHVRDITIDKSSGSSHPGKFIGLVEKGTNGPGSVKTGIDHIAELGATHVHLLPSFDNYSIKEDQLDSPQFNWGYDPQNYNVPEGSFSTDPFNAEVRIKEFKQMVKGFHDNGIGVILDVVYNHTGRTENSNFNLEAPGYYYRQWEDGKWSDASACGNETASDRPMMRKFIIESILYWTKEYHLDGFRFDLMGIHDIETMNAVAEAVKKVNHNIFIYGEGWTAGDSPLPEPSRALKKYTYEMPLISAFSDDLRDGLKGSVFEDKDTGFVSGKAGMEESIKFGVVGSIEHPQIDYKAVNYSDAAWATEPWQAVSYVSCHDNHTIYDKLKISKPETSEEDIIAMDKLANAIVLTSQGMSFLHAGAELLRTKGGEHNSYNLPDSVNKIDWNWKVNSKTVFDYYKNLIQLRKNHPAFFMPTGELVREHLVFFETEPGIVAYTISDNANGDSWKDILVIYNANEEEVSLDVPEEWNIVVKGDTFNEKGIEKVKGKVKVPRLSMLVGFRE